MGNVIQKKCCEEIDSLFSTNEPLGGGGYIYTVLYQVSCVAQTQPCTIQKNYANDVLI
jgi:hypothetical protein